LIRIPEKVIKNTNSEGEFLGITEKKPRLFIVSDYFLYNVLIVLNKRSLNFILGATLKVFQIDNS